MYDPLNVYIGRYKEFIESIREMRPMNERMEYCDDHHTIPRCTFEDSNDPRIDDEDNHINLTYREHFIAHKILWEENPENKRLFHAYWRMCNGRTKLATPEEYEEARRVHSEYIRLYPPALGKHWNCSELTRKKMSDSGKVKIFSSEHRKNLSIALSGRGNPRYGKLGKDSPSYGSKRSEELKDKYFRGENNPFYGKHHSEDTRKKMRERCKDRKFHLICRNCGSEFLGTCPTNKYCINCKEKGLV